MPQYPIPQFIEEEGKIIFFLTFRQFFLLIGAGATCLVLYFFLPFFLFVILSFIVGVSTFAVAFLKINNESVVKLLLNFIAFSTGTKSYTWDKKESAYPFKVKEHRQIQNIEGPLGLKTHMGNTSKLKEAKKLVETKK